MTLTDKPIDFARDQGRGLAASNNVAANDALLAQVQATQPKDNYEGTEAMLAALNPQDPIEAMMNAQLLASHNVAMALAAKLQDGSLTFHGLDMLLPRYTALSKATAALVEARARHMGKGSHQTIKVEKVTVEDGGQAIVGSVGRGGGG